MLVPSLDITCIAFKSQRAYTTLTHPHEQLVDSINTVPWTMLGLRAHSSGSKRPSWVGARLCWFLSGSLTR